MSNYFQEGENSTPQTQKIELTKIQQIIAYYNAIKDKIALQDDMEVLDTLAFSSIRKYGGIKTKKKCYYLGSPENLLQKVGKYVKAYEEEYRVLALTESNNKFENITNVKVLGYILIHDEIKTNANTTLTYFKNEGVDVKIISGDNEKTVASIAEKVGINDVKAIDFSFVEDEDIPKVVEEYNIFGRVKPDQKKKIIIALKEKGHFVAMTGDGVNDCLALKEADCSIAMASGNLKHAQNIRFKNIPEMVHINRNSKIIVNVIILIPPLLISISISLPFRAYQQKQ